MHLLSGTLLREGLNRNTEGSMRLPDIEDHKRLGDQRDCDRVGSSTCRAAQARWGDYVCRLDDRWTWADPSKIASL